MKSIQTRLIIVVSFFVLAITLSFTSFYYLQIRSNAIKNLINEANTIISSFYAIMRSDLPENQTDLSLFVRLEVTSKGAIYLPDVINLHSNLDGVIFINTDRKILSEHGVDIDITEDNLRLLLDENKVIASNFHEKIAIYIPFVFQGENLGGSILFFSAREIHEQEQHIFQTAVIVFVVFQVIGVLGAYFIGRTIAKPIVDLAVSISKKSINEISLNLDRKDEIGIFAKSFTQLQEIVNQKISTLNKEITDRKIVEAKLKDSEMFLNTIIEHIPNMIFVKEAEGLRFIEFNKAGENLLGHTREDLIGKSDYDLFSKEEADLFTGQDREALGKGTLLDIPEEPIETKLKGKRILHTQKIPIFDEKGNPVYLLGISEDITEKKQLEEQLRQSQKMEAIGMMAGGIAHDFNNILGAILGYSEMAQMQAPEGSTLRADLDKVVLAGNRAKELVAQILAFSRKEKSEQKPLQPQPIIKEAIKLVRSSIPTTIIIKQDLDEGCGMVEADPIQLHQIVMNLCTNAYQAMEEHGGTLSLGLEKTELTENDLQDEPSLMPGSYVQLTVIDTGPGIDPTTLKHVFDPYFTTKELGKGTGLGLAVVHGIVANHGGMIRIYSQLGTGTTVHVFFPESLKGDDENIEKVQPLPAGNERILFVEDDLLLADMGKQLLEQMGYSVVASTNSIEALEMFKAQPEQFDLVVTDQTMPGITGSELAREILSIAPNMPVILCTGYSNIISKEEALAVGIRAFIMKPMARKDIALLIREVLNGEKNDSEQQKTHSV